LKLAFPVTASMIDRERLASGRAGRSTFACQWTISGFGGLSIFAMNELSLRGAQPCPAVHAASVKSAGVPVTAGRRRSSFEIMQPQNRGALSLP
jgi:hypothetical protein